MILSDKMILKKTIKDINKDQNISDEEKDERIVVIKNILAIKDRFERYSKLYDMICDYLDTEFRTKNVCGFKDDLCSRRRDMIERGIKKDSYKNGCCHGYKAGGDCVHLKDGHCTIKNIACKTFTCPFLRKQGIKYSINQIYFAKYFFNFRQKLYMQTTFFVDKDVVLKGILERM